MRPEPRAPRDDDGDLEDLAFAPIEISPAHLRALVRRREGAARRRGRTGRRPSRGAWLYLVVAGVWAAAALWC